MSASAYEDALGDHRWPEAGFLAGADDATAVEAELSRLQTVSPSFAKEWRN